MTTPSDPSEPGRETPRPVTRRRNLSLVASLLAFGALTYAVVTGDGGTPEGRTPGPTRIAEQRDLTTTLEASGRLRRSEEHTVGYAGIVPSNGEGVGTDPGGTPAALAGAPSGTDPASTTTPLPTSTSSSSSSTTASTTSTSSTRPTTTTSPCPPDSTSTTTSSSTSSTSTTEPCPPSTTTPTTTPTTTRPDDGDPGGGGDPDDGVPGGNGGPDPVERDPDGPEGPGGQQGPGGQVGQGAPGAQVGQGGPGGSGDPGSEGGTDPAGQEPPSATLTSLLDVGETAGRGTELYTADEQPVISLLGDLPAWRTLEEGVDDGPDVRQLEENLVELGYGTDLDVDESYTAATAAAVEDWETDLGRTSPDGTVTLGDVVFLTEAGDVLSHEASVGDTLQAGAPVITLGSEQRLVVADVDAVAAGGWAPGSTVELEWGDTTTTEGTVLGVGRDATNGTVELFVAVDGDNTGDRLSGAETTVTLPDAHREDAVAVPVAAVVDDDGRPAVWVEGDDGTDEIVPVELGLVASGWVEITSGLDGGEAVRLPG